MGTVYVVAFNHGFVKVGYSQKNPDARVCAAKRFAFNFVENTSVVEQFISPDHALAKSTEDMLIEFCAKQNGYKPAFGSAEWYFCNDDGAAVLSFAKSINYENLNFVSWDDIKKNKEDIERISKDISSAAQASNIDRLKHEEIWKKKAFSDMLVNVTSKTIEKAEQKSVGSKETLESLSGLKAVAMSSAEQIAFFSTLDTIDHMIEYAMQARFGVKAYSISDSKVKKMVSVCADACDYGGPSDVIAKNFVQSWYVAMSMCADIIKKQ